MSERERLVFGSPEADRIASWNRSLDYLDQEERELDEECERIGLPVQHVSQQEGE